MTETEFTSEDATGLAELIQKKSVAASEVLGVAISRAEKLNPLINAINTPMFDLARAQVRSGPLRAPFFGVPFLLKDLRASYRGVPTSLGHSVLQYTPDSDSFVTKSYKDAGLIIMGKTNVPEIGFYAHSENRMFGVTRNPWELNHSPGGSSGGSAAAVAARIVPAAHATDGGGSTRIPAACCGLFGLKTSRGRVSYGPDSGEEIIGMSTQHACTISVRDSAALLDVISAPQFGDPYWAPPAPGPYTESIKLDPRRLRIALVTTAPNGLRADEECVAAVERAAKLCETLGHSVETEKFDVHWTENAIDEAIDIIWSVAVASAVQARFAAASRVPAEKDLIPYNWMLYRKGMEVQGIDYVAAVRRIHALTRQADAFYDRYDALLTPTLPSPPALISDFDPADAKAFERAAVRATSFTRFANATGQPAMTVPLGWSRTGLPIGVQFSARFGAEHLLLQLAAQLERAAPWAHRTPEIALSSN